MKDTEQLAKERGTLVKVPMQSKVDRDAMFQALANAHVPCWLETQKRAFDTLYLVCFDNYSEKELWQAVDSR